MLFFRKLSKCTDDHEMHKGQVNKTILSGNCLCFENICSELKKNVNLL